MTKFFLKKKIVFEIFKIGKILKFFKNHGKQTKHHSDKKNLAYYGKNRIKIGRAMKK